MNDYRVTTQSTQEAPMSKADVLERCKAGKRAAEAREAAETREAAEAPNGHRTEAPNGHRANGHRANGHRTEAPNGHRANGQLPIANWKPDPHLRVILPATILADGHARPVDVTVFAALCSYGGAADRSGHRWAWPSIPAIEARSAGLKRSAVKSSLNRLGRLAETHRPPLAAIRGDRLMAPLTAAAASNSGCRTTCGRRPAAGARSLRPRAMVRRCSGPRSTPAGPGPAGRLP